MKTRFIRQYLITFALATASLVTGCAQQKSGSTPTSGLPSSTPPPPVVTQVVPVETAVVPPANPAPVAPVAAPVPPLIISNPPPPAVAAGSVLPANLRLSKPLNEVIQLARSGVDETVVLLYITNTTAFFKLGAEEIVYLNDLGVSGTVITAMMERDRTLKIAWANAATAAALSNAEPVAVAPTYANPPPALAGAAPEAAPVYVSNDYFYESLSPYGTWVEIDGYGRCWRPTVAITSPTWQPYRDRGRWVNTDSGWYWMSDYSWGSVAFHYGRWFSHPRWGWCWWPDSVWAPSWVTWRYDNVNCGWAALPPYSYYNSSVGFTYYDRAVDNHCDFGLSVGFYTFVPWVRFCDPYPYRHCLPPPQCVAIYNQTTIINNVVIGDNNTLINHGIPKDRVQEHTRAEVRTVKLQPENAQGRSLRQDHFERDGRTLVARRPQVSPENRSPARNASGRPPEGGVINPKTTPANVSPESGARPERQGSRPVVMGNENRPSSRTTTPIPSTPATPTATKTPASSVATVPPAVGRPESSQPERRTRTEETRTTRNPSQITTVPAPAAPAPITRTTPTPARIATPIFSKPVVIQTPPQLPARPGQITPNQSATVIGGNRSSSPSGRDYTVWTTPTPQPTPPVSVPSYNNANNSPGRSRSGIEQVSQMLDNQTSQPTPNYNRPAIEVKRETTTRSSDAGGRNTQNRSEVRIVAPSYPPPAPRVAAPIITPAPVMTPTPRPSFTPAPTLSAPVPSQPTPTGAAPRSESKPASGRSPQGR